MIEHLSTVDCARQTKVTEKKRGREYTKRNTIVQSVVIYKEKIGRDRQRERETEREKEKEREREKREEKRETADGEVRAVYSRKLKTPNHRVESLPPPLLPLLGTAHALLKPCI